MAEKIPCPNCLELAEKTGNVITCQACDSVFKITKTGSATVQQVGWKEELENQVKKNTEQLVTLLGGEPGVEDDADAEELPAEDLASLESEAGIEDDDILPP